jgi:hypothetical protein
LWVHCAWYCSVVTVIFLVVVAASKKGLHMLLQLVL